MTTNRRCFCLGLAGAAATLAAGCASSRPLFVPYAPPPSADGKVDEHQAVVYVYRPQAPGAAARVSSLIDVDGQHRATVENGQYVPLLLPPGPHPFTHRWKTGVVRDAESEQWRITIPVLAVHGRPRYLRLGMQASQALAALGLEDVRKVRDWELREVTAAEAQDEIRACRLGDVKPLNGGIDPDDPEIGTPVGAPGL